MTIRTLPSILLFTLMLFVTGCGGQTPRLPLDGASTDPLPNPTPTPVTSSATIWKFQDGFGHHMNIAVSSLPCAYGICDGNIVLWHYTKDNCQAYWNPRTAAQCTNALRLDELWFVIHKDTDGAWRSIGFNYVDYLDRKWKVQILPVSGQPPAYTIIPSSPSASDPPTSYNAIVQENPSGDVATDFSVPPGTANLTSTWQTFSGSEIFGTEVALISHQHENCIEEKWDFFGTELMQVVPIVGIGDNNPCLVMDSRLTMVRIN